MENVQEVPKTPNWSARMTERKLETAEHKHFTGVYSFVDENGRPMIAMPADTHYARSYAQKEAYKQKLERDQQIAEQREKDKSVGFTLTDMEAVKEVASVLTTTQCGFLHVLQCYVSFDTGVIIKSSKDKTPMTPADMIDTLGVARRTFYDFLDACKAHDIIVETDLGYVINPKYHFKGSTRNARVIRTYIARMKEVHRDIKPVDIGLIYRMLPLVHLTTNVLVADPYATEPEILNRKQLAEALDIDPDTLSRRLKRLKFGDQYACAKVEIGPIKGYALNPMVWRRAMKEPDATMMLFFKAAAKKGK